MRGRTLLFPLIILAWGCSEPSEAELEAKARWDAEAIAGVEAAQTMPAVPVTPEPMAFAEMEKAGALGAGCAFIPKGGGLSALALALPDAGFLKVGGTIQRLAPDLGSAEAPLGTRMKYDGREYSFTLSRDGEPVPAGTEVLDYPGSLVIRDGRGRTLFEARGTTQCGS